MKLFGLIMLLIFVGFGGFYIDYQIKTKLYPAIEAYFNE